MLTAEERIEAAVAGVKSFDGILAGIRLAMLSLESGDTVGVMRTLQRLEGNLESIRRGLLEASYSVTPITKS